MTESSVWPDVGGGGGTKVICLSVLLGLTALTNLTAAPVILFRRTRFGNGQFACLLLCLTITDLTSSSLGLLGGLVLELRDLAWPGTSQSCAAYYFSTSWLLSLSNYLIVCLLSPAQVKTVPASLLLSLLLLSLLAAIPELAIRSTLSLAGTEPVCILTTSTTSQALVTTLRLVVRNLVPALLVIRPARHCPLLAGRLSPSQERPDILQDTSTEIMLEDNRQILEEKHSSYFSEDPTRKVYKRAMTIIFLLTNFSSLLVDILSQIQSEELLSFLTSYTFLDDQYLSETKIETAMDTSLNILMYTQCVANPLIFIFCEFFL